MTETMRRARERDRSKSSKRGYKRLARSRSPKLGAATVSRKKAAPRSGRERSGSKTFKTLNTDRRSRKLNSSSKATTTRVMGMTSLQEKAFGAVQEASIQHDEAALPRLIAKAELLGFNKAQLSSCLQHIRDKASLLIHVHLPSRLQSLLADSHYRSMFETGTSQASNSRNERGSWESNLFLGRYDDASDFERVKYGKLPTINRFAEQHCQAQSTCSMILKEFKGLVVMAVRSSSCAITCDNEQH